MHTRLFSRLCGEDGIALVMALVYSIMLLGAGTTFVYFATTNQDSAAESNADQLAFQLGEAGLNEAIAVVMNASNPSQSSTLPDNSAGHPAYVDTSTSSKGTVSYWGTYDSPTNVWTLYGKGGVKAPNATGTLYRTVSEKVRVGAGGATLSGNAAWGYIFADNKDGGCVTLSSSVHIDVSMFVTGNLCLDNSARIEAQASPVSVGGTLQITSSASLGQSTAHVAEFHVGTGCRYGTTGSFTFPCTTTQHVYVDAEDQSVPAITKPPVDMPYWYANAKPGPNHPCTSGSFPSSFDTGDGVMNGSVGTVTNMFGSTAYDCVVTESGQTVGEIRWTPGNPATLYVNGTVFIDGSLNVQGSGKIDYSGRGSIYASGSIYIGQSMQFCGKRSGGSCDWTVGSWDPEQELICWIAGTTLTLDSSVQMQGALYAGTTYTQTSSVHEQGPIVTSDLNFGSSAQTKWLPFIHLAPGMPQASSAWTAAVIPGTWSG
jgi:Tfp pilus assembly protein PilX